MDMKYKNMLNAHAFNALPNSAVIPDFRLGIGDAERLDSIPVLIFTEVAPKSNKPTFEDVTTQPIEKFGFTGDGQYIEEDDFISEDFFEALQGMGDY